MISSFKELSLHPQILTILDKMGVTQPTDIQQKSIPVLLGTDKVDFWGQAQTGTGKTFAFGIPLVQNINPSENNVQALIIAPTRELVVQITQALQSIGAPISVKIEAIYGGSSMEKQMSALRRGVHIVVGTPGRINDHLSRRTLVLKNLQTLVLDEADIMLDMGFKEEVDTILQATPSNRKIWLFSATMKSGITSIMHEHMKNTVKVSAVGQQTSTGNTKQFYAVASSKDRFTALCRFIDANPTFYGFIFCQTKILTASIAEKLAERGYKADALHGDMNQSLRNSIIKKFKNKEFNVLVATDVAARGIDVVELTHVINYSLPNDHESYIHRIGRTGRAGKEGIAISFINSKHEVRHIQMFERKFKMTIKPITVPTFTDIQKVHLEKAKEYLEATCSKSATTAAPEEFQQALTQYTQEQLANFALNIISAKFFAAAAQENDSLSSSSNSSSSRYESGRDDSQELVIHLGSDDGISTEDISDLLAQNSAINADAIEKLKVIKRRTFIKVPTNMADTLLDYLQGKTVQGKKIRISLSEDTDNGGGRDGGRDTRRRSSSSFGRGGGSSFGKRDGGFRRSSSNRRSEKSY